MSKKDPFASRMFKRTKAIYERIEQIDQAVSQAVPVLQRAVAGNKKQLEALQTVLKSMEAYHSEIDAATGHISELDPTSLKYELANITTFINAMDVYFAAEPETVKGALEKFDIQVLIEALAGLSDSRFNKIEESVSFAKARRYNKRLKAGENG